MGRDTVLATEIKIDPDFKNGVQVSQNSYNQSVKFWFLFMSN